MHLKASEGRSDTSEWRALQMAGTLSKECKGFPRRFARQCL